jgi:hypothetical protein
MIKARCNEYKAIAVVEHMEAAGQRLLCKECIHVLSLLAQQPHLFSPESAG